jgi:hypothetical protein
VIALIAPKKLLFGLNNRAMLAGRFLTDNRMVI